MLGDIVRRAGGLALCASLVTCHGVSYTLSDSVDDEAALEIQRAADRWNSVVRPECRVEPGRGWRISLGDPGTGFDGITHRSTRSVVIRAQPVHSSVFHVALHELGHTIGLNHPCTLAGVDDEVAGRPPCRDAGPALGVMDPLHVTDIFTASDILECRAVGACL